VSALAGFGPRDLSSWRRAVCLGFTAVSLPFQFMPAVVAANSKAGERRAVSALSAYLAAIDDVAPAGALQTVARS
jgi:hypothetical protein